MIGVATEIVGDLAHWDRVHFVTIGRMEAPVDREHFALSLVERLFVAGERYRPFELGIARAYLIFVGSVVSPESVGGCRFQD